MAQRSGQTTVVTSGTAVPLAGSYVNADGPVSIKALEANTGKCYIGNDGSDDVTTNNGYELGAGDYVVLNYVGGLDKILVDASDNGQAVCWLILGPME